MFKLKMYFPAFANTYEMNSSGDYLFEMDYNMGVKPNQPGGERGQFKREPSEMASDLLAINSIVLQQYRTHIIKVKLYWWVSN